MHFTVEGDGLLELRIRTVTEALNGPGREAGDPGERQCAVEEPPHRDLVRGDQRCRGPWSREARVAGNRERREALRVWSLEGHRGMVDQVQAGLLPADAPGPGQAVLDRDSHV